MLPSIKRTLATETPEEISRNSEIRKRLINEFSITVKELQRVHLGSDYEIDKNDEYGLMLCTLLEAVFLHGYHEHSVKLSNFYNILGRISSEATPSHSFWAILVDVTHQDVIQEIENLSHISSPIGHCRAWIRLALNEGLMESYINSLLSDIKKIQTYYKPSAFLRDGELPYIMVSFLQGIAEFKFHLNYNTPSLNTWTGDTLAYAGVWQLAKIASPVPSNRPAATPRGTSLPSSQSAFRPIATKTVTHTYNDAPPRKKSGSPKLYTSKEIDQPKPKITREETCQDTVNDDAPLVGDPTEGDDSTDNQAKTEPVEHISANNQSPPAISPVLMMGSNKLGINNGWSSAFQVEHKETQPAADAEIENQQDNGGDQKARGGQEKLNEQEDREDSSSKRQEVPTQSTAVTASEPANPPPKVVSYNTLLSDYTVQAPATFPTSSFEEEEDAPIVETRKIPSPESPDFSHKAGFEVVPHCSSVHSEHADNHTQDLMAILTHIANEQGLDSQNYQCKGCGRNIGMIYGEAKVCSYDGGYYCYECHMDEDHVIPARVIYNWDLRKHRVARCTKLFLLQIEEEPLLNIDETNPTLYSVVEELEEIKVLRQQLQHLKGFLLTCKQPIADDIRRRIWPREYLWDDIHQYSLLDLIQTQSGQLAHHLKKIIGQCTKHVYKCDLCCQKGFICEFCNDPKIIYPFEVKTTFQCPKCKSVSHKSCKRDENCPKCARRQKLKAAKLADKTSLDFDSTW
ncbi:sorting nexin-29 isoform X2 [Nematostella vectensis]|uniref:sorting nexin-29 isoform X2 n=1 Tax=Nematostella vectensis TaxID=45351 RepID=UPI00138FC302|nr:sorting nexin-29 isoform X2 [Nematostella vectensis]